MQAHLIRTSRPVVLWHVTLAVLLVTAIGAVAWAPREETMGDAQRVLYIHVSVAWLSLAAFLVMAITGAAYLWRRNLDWDHYSRAAGEVGWLCCSLTLITGSLWAHAAWGTWWTWDPRLLTSFILWVLYSAYLLIRENIPDPHARARLAAVIAILGVLDVPLVVMATRWFRGMHPVTPSMEPIMRVVLLITVLGFTVLTSTLFVYRRLQIRLDYEITELEGEFGN